MSSYTQEVFTSNSLGENSIEFEFGTDRNFYLDMPDIVLVSSFNYSMESGKRTCSIQLHENYSKKLYHSITSKPIQ